MIGPQIGFNPRAGLPQVPQGKGTKPTAQMGTKQPSVSPNMTAMDAEPMTSMDAAPIMPMTSMTPMSPVDQRIAGLQDRMSMMPRTQMPQADASAFSMDQIFGKGQSMKPQIGVDFGTGLPSGQQVIEQMPQVEESILERGEQTKKFTMGEVNTLIRGLDDTAALQVIEGLLENGYEVVDDTPETPSLATGLSKLQSGEDWEQTPPENFAERVIRDWDQSIENLKGIGNILAGAGTAVGTIPTNLLATAQEIFGSPEKADNYRRMSEDIQDFLVKRLGADEESRDFKASKLVSDIATFLVPSTKITKGGIALSKAMNTIQNPIVRNAAKAIILGGIGAMEADLFTAATEGRTATTGERALGAGINLAIPAGSSLMRRLREIGNATPEQVVTGTFRPRTISQKLLGSVNKIDPSKNAEFAKRYGTNSAEWLQERGIIDAPENTINQLYDRFTKYRAVVDDALQSMEGVTIRPNDFQGKDDWIKIMLDDALEMANSTRSPNRQSLANLAEKYQVAGLSPSEVNEVKRVYERTNKFTYNKNIVSPEKAELATNIDSGVREMLMDKAEQFGFTNMREINKEISASKFLMDELAKKYNKQLSNEVISLTDYVVGGGIGIESVVAKRILTSRRVLALLSELTNTTKRIPDPNVDYDLIRATVRQNIPTLPEPRSTPIAPGGLPEQPNIISPIPKRPEVRQIIEGGQGNIRNPIDGRIPQLPAGLGTAQNPIIGGRSLNPTNIDDIVPPARTSNMDIRQPSAMLKAPDDLISEARKYKTVDEFIDKDIVVYRGVGGDLRPNTTLVSGRYFANTKDMAAKYGDVKEYTIPKGSKIYDFDNVKFGKIELDPLKMRYDLIEKGYDFTKNTNVGGLEYVDIRPTPLDIYRMLGKGYFKNIKKIPDNLLKQIDTNEKFIKWINQEGGDYLKSEKFYSDILPQLREIREQANK